MNIHVHFTFIAHTLSLLCILGSLHIDYLCSKYKAFLKAKISIQNRMHPKSYKIIGTEIVTNSMDQKSPENVGIPFIYTLKARIDTTDISQS
jgi:hypothetical protein